MNMFSNKYNSYEIRNQKVIMHFSTILMNSFFWHI